VFFFCDTKNPKVQQISSVTPIVFPAQAITANWGLSEVSEGVFDVHFKDFGASPAHLNPLKLRGGGKS